MLRTACLIGRRPLVVLLLAAAVFLAACLEASGSAAFRQGDVVPMSYRSQLTGSSVEELETPWDEALRSQMPRYGRPGTVSFDPVLPESYSSKGKLAVALAFSQERFVLPRVAVREAGGGGPRLVKLVVTFVCDGGDIVSVRSDPVYENKVIRGGAEGRGFDVEYRWDHQPGEDQQAGTWLLFAASLVVTVVLAVDVCNGPAGGGGGGGGEQEVADRSGRGGVDVGVGGRAERRARMRASEERRRR